MKGWFTKGLESFNITNPRPLVTVKIPPMTRVEWELFTTNCLAEGLIDAEEAKDWLDNDRRIKPEGEVE